MQKRYSIKIVGIPCHSDWEHDNDEVEISVSVEIELEENGQLKVNFSTMAITPGCDTEVEEITEE